MLLHNIFRPKKDYHLVRLGRDNDGGYLVGSRAINESEILISFGINDDWSFEKDFLKKNNIKILCYDKTYVLDILKKKLLFNLKSFFKKFRFFKIFKNILNIFEFINLKKKIIFLKKEIKAGDLTKIINEINSNKIFIKIDIEGGEYEILEEILINQTKFTCLIIEFHKFDINEEIIINFKKNLNLELTHIHPNNYSVLNEKNDPTVVEMTFEKNPEIIGENKVLPNKLDMKNWKRGPQIDLKFHE